MFVIIVAVLAAHELFTLGDVVGINQYAYKLDKKLFEQYDVQETPDNYTFNVHDEDPFQNELLKHSHFPLVIWA